MHLTMLIVMVVGVGRADLEQELIGGKFFGLYVRYSFA